MSDRIGFTNGVFDLFHDGHRYLLQEAAKGLDLLIVGINSDASTRRLKGNSRPVHSVTRRVKNVVEYLNSLRPLRFTVTVFHTITPEKLIQAYLPHVLIKGSDAPRPLPGEDVVRGYGGEIRIVSRLPGFSTTEQLKARQ